MLQDFEFVSARTLDQALAVLADGAAETRVVAGGTNLLVNLRADRERPRRVVDIMPLRQELGEIERQNGTIRIGALATLGDLLASSVLDADAAARVLVASAHDFANPLIRNRATLGGNVVDGSPAADLLPPLLALDARARLASQARGERVVPLNQFYLDYHQTAMAPDELLLAVEVPAAGPRMGSGWYKLGLRKADAIAIISAACVVGLDAEGRCASVRIGLGAVAPTVIRATPAEQALGGARLDAAAVERAGAAAAEAVRPIDDVRATGAYRRQMSRVLVQRTLRQAVGQARGERDDAG